jgi:hypothetical protein
VQIRNYQWWVGRNSAIEGIKELDSVSSIAMIGTLEEQLSAGHCLGRQAVDQYCDGYNLLGLEINDS